MNRKAPIVLAVLFAAVAFPAAAEPDPATMVMMCDTNGDNAVTQKEWDACGAPSAYPADKDDNQDGKVTVDEMAGAPPSNEQPKPR